MYLSRRHFINLFTAGCVLPLVNACKKNEATLYDNSDRIFKYNFSNKIVISDNDIIVFQGDSITECNRNKQVMDANVNSGLGNGYTCVIADNFLKNHASENVFFFNRGVSGNMVTDLSKRWTVDCIDLKPTIVNILIGVNDLRNDVSPNSYYTNYSALLQDTRNRLPNAKLIICEPFLFPNFAAYDRFSSPYHEYRKIVRVLARDFDTVFIPYYELLLKDDQNQTSYDIISTDGFHPTLFGQSLMAGIWLNYLA